MASVHQTLWDVCEQPIQELPRAVHLDNDHSYGMRMIGEGTYVSLHMHAHCWDAIRGQFLGERRRDDEAASRRAKERQGCNAKKEPWLVRFVRDLLNWLGS